MASSAGLVPSSKIRDLRDNRRAILSDYQILLGEFYDKNTPNEALTSIGLPDDMHFMIAEIRVDKLLTKTVKWEEASDDIDAEDDTSEQDKAEQVKAQQELFETAHNLYEEDLSQLEALRGRLEDSKKGEKGYYIYKLGSRFQVIGNQYEEAEVAEGEEAASTPKPKVARSKKRPAPTPAKDDDDDSDNDLSPSSAATSKKKSKNKATPAKPTRSAVARSAPRKSSSKNPSDSSKQPSRKVTARTANASPPVRLSNPTKTTAATTAASDTSDDEEASPETLAENERLREKLAKLEAEAKAEMQGGFDENAK